MQPTQVERVHLLNRVVTVGAADPLHPSGGEEGEAVEPALHLRAGQATATGERQIESDARSSNPVLPSFCSRDILAPVMISTVNPRACRRLAAHSAARSDSSQGTRTNNLVR